MQVIDEKFLETELTTLVHIRDRADAQARIWQRTFEQAVGSIEALERLKRFIASGSSESHQPKGLGHHEPPVEGAPSPDSLL